MKSKCDTSYFDKGHGRVSGRRTTSECGQASNSNSLISFREQDKIEVAGFQVINATANCTTLMAVHINSPGFKELRKQLKEGRGGVSCSEHYHSLTITDASLHGQNLKSAHLKALENTTGTLLRNFADCFFIMAFS